MTIDSSVPIFWVT